MVNKLAYIAYSNEASSGGVIKKITTSINTWRNFGIESKLFLLTKNSHLHTELISKFSLDIIKTYIFNSYIDQVIQYNKIIKDVIDFSPTLIYYRYYKFIPGYIKLSSHLPIVIEINTNDIQEKKIHTKVDYFYNKFTRHMVFKRCKGIVSVSPELPFLPEFSKFKKPFLVLGNAIDTSLIPKLEPTKNATPHLIFLGSLNQPWQGIDKVFTLAKTFPEWYIHIVGGQNNYKNAPSNLKFYGFLEFDKYIEIMNQADCALGPLALHKKQMNCTSSLKIIEYLAFGLPVILSYQETNFPEDAPFFLILPNIEYNIIPNKQII